MFQIIEIKTLSFEGQTKITEKVIETLNDKEKAEYSLRDWNKLAVEGKREFLLKEVEGIAPNGYHVIMAKDSKTEELKTVSISLASEFVQKFENQGFEKVQLKIIAL